MVHSVLKSTRSTQKASAISRHIVARHILQCCRVGAMNAIVAMLCWGGLADSTWAMGNKNNSINVGAKTLRVEIADTPSTRQTGLMNREILAEDEGMLFIFDSPSLHCMWMKNTPLDLDVAFINAEGRIVNIHSMWAQTTDLHCAKRPATMALEVNRGWFSKNQIVPGTKVERID